MKIKEIHLIHHSHTDIGYTDTQEVIENFHVDFIRQAINILDKLKNTKEYDEWFWTCENFWQVENFLERANEIEQEKFIAYLKEGKIDFTLNYLNFTELVTKDLLDGAQNRIKKFCQTHNLDKKVAMTADINGYSQAFNDALYAGGARCLLTNIHTHHGNNIDDKSPNLFIWETSNGSNLLTLEANVYVLGHELGMVPMAGSTYNINDNNKFYNHELQIDEKTKYENLEFSAQRILNFVDFLEQNNFPAEIFPVMAGGITGDNACPSIFIPGRLKELNKILEGKVILKMSTPSIYFQELNLENTVNTYVGDWNDWWADGVGSTPSELKVYKNALRNYKLCKRLEPNYLDEILEKNLLLYAEHTWGYSSSVFEPWNKQVKELEMRKANYALQADILANKKLISLLEENGKITNNACRDLSYTVINPSKLSRMNSIGLLVEDWDNIQGHDLMLGNAKLVDELDNNLIFDYRKTGRGWEINFNDFIEDNDNKKYKLLWNEEYKNFKLNISDCHPDFHEKNIENSFFNISVNKTKNEILLFDKTDKVYLSNLDQYGNIFQPFYSTKDTSSNQWEGRREMGRLRNHPKCNLTEGKITGYTVEKLKTYEIMTINYCLDGCLFFDVIITLFKDLKKIDIKCRLAKQLTWNYESVYFTLPTFISLNQKLWLDKSGELVDFEKCKMPNKNLEFALTTSGFCIETEKQYAMFYLKDAPLVTLKDFSDFSVDDNYNKINDGKMIKSWLMNNFWETNFKVDLSGFYDFDYSIVFVDKNSDMQETFNEYALDFISFNNSNILSKD